MSLAQRDIGDIEQNLRPCIRRRSSNYMESASTESQNSYLHWTVFTCSKDSSKDSWLISWLTPAPLTRYFHWWIMASYTNWMIDWLIGSFTAVPPPLSTASPSHEREWRNELRHHHITEWISIKTAKNATDTYNAALCHVHMLHVCRSRVLVLPSSVSSQHRWDPVFNSQHSKHHHHHHHINNNITKVFSCTCLSLTAPYTSLVRHSPHISRWTRLLECQKMLSIQGCGLGQEHN